MKYVFHNIDLCLFLKTISVLYASDKQIYFVFSAFPLLLFLICSAASGTIVLSQTHLVPCGTSCLHWMHGKLEFNGFQFLTKKVFSCIFYISVISNYARIAPNKPLSFHYKSYVHSIKISAHKIFLCFPRK